MKQRILKSFLRIFLLCTFIFTSAVLKSQNSPTVRITDSLKAIVKEYCKVDRVNSVSLNINKKQKTITVNCAQGLNEMPFRIENVKRIYNALDTILKPLYPEFSISCITDRKPIEFFIPNYYRKGQLDSTRIFINPKPDKALIRELNTHVQFNYGLANKYIALWPSHGSYYDIKEQNWKWQRPVIFRTVEDLLSVSFVIPYLVPMLENAGAQIFLPRERDPQAREIIIDRDNSSPGSKYLSYNDRYQWTRALGGFANLQESYSFGENPFTKGSFDFIRSTTDSFESSRVEWVPEISATGWYSVYISYHSFPNSADDVVYQVLSPAGNKDFQVNQTMGGGTWIHLGRFYFEKGRHKYQKIILSNLSSSPDRVITADAIKIGGGTGNIQRGPDSLSMIANRLNNKPSTSGKPRFEEGSRYWLQWAGMPDSIYSRTQNQNDYLDDFQSRGFWVNHLKNELDIPIDLAFALHTDAGSNKGDTIIGTLGICTAVSTQKKDKFPNGSSRWASRDLTDLIQTQIVEDIRQNFYQDWTRRGIWNRSYSESREPDVPTMLLELLSHQNYADMQFAHDPKFRFAISRAIYKGMVNYFTALDGIEYRIAPLAVNNFHSELSQDGTVVLRWKASIEKGEERSLTEKFILYTSADGIAFDKGRILEQDTIVFKLKKEQQFYYKICALNEGGISFPSEILSVYFKDSNSPRILIVNGYNQLSAPDSFTKDTLEAGFNTELDYGSPEDLDYHIVGKQIDFNKNSKYINMDVPGHGETDLRFEIQNIIGNNFSYTQYHGDILKKLDYSYCTSTRDAFESQKVNANKYDAVDLILGNQRQVVEGLKSKLPEYKTFTLALQLVIEEYLKKGGKLIVSGANIASDLTSSGDKNDIRFMHQVLKIKGHKSNNDSLELTQWRKSNKNYSFTNKAKFTNGKDFKFYKFRPDEIELATNDAFILGRYDNKKACAIFFDGTYKICNVSFPLESIEDEDESLDIFSIILKLMFKTN